MIEISFIIPCYNVEKYLDSCIKSIQNLGIKQENYEIIIIDDGSKDNTINIMKEYEDLDNIKLIFFDKPSGYAGKPRNAGLKIAKGEFISFIDPDDKFTGQGLYEVYKKYHQDYDLIISSFVLKNPYGKLTDKIILKDKDSNQKKDLWPQIKNVCNQRSLFKKQFIVDNKIMFYEDCRSQDLLFLYSCYVKVAKIRLTSNIVLEYLDERENSISNVISDKYIETSLLAFTRLYQLINNKLSKREVKNIMSEHFIGYYLNVRKVINKEQKQKIKVFINEVNL